MSLEQALHTRWAGTTALTTLVPAARVTTGPRSDSAPRPFVTLTRLGLIGVLRTSSREVKQARVRFDVHSDWLSQGKAVAAAVRGALERQSFEAGGVRVLRLREVEHQEQRSDDGGWLLRLEFAAWYEAIA